MLFSELQPKLKLEDSILISNLLPAAGMVIKKMEIKCDTYQGMDFKKKYHVLLMSKLIAINKYRCGQLQVLEKN